MVTPRSIVVFKLISGINMLPQVYLPEHSSPQSHLPASFIWNFSLLRWISISSQRNWTRTSSTSTTVGQQTIHCSLDFMVPTASQLIVSPVRNRSCLSDSLVTLLWLTEASALITKLCTSVRHSDHSVFNSLGTMYSSVTIWPPVYAYINVGYVNLLWNQRRVGNCCTVGVLSGELCMLIKPSLHRFLSFLCFAAFQLAHNVSPEHSKRCSENKLQLLRYCAL